MSSLSSQKHGGEGYFFVTDKQIAKIKFPWSTNHDKYGLSSQFYTVFNSIRSVKVYCSYILFER